MKKGPELLNHCGSDVSVDQSGVNKTDHKQNAFEEPKRSLNAALNRKSLTWLTFVHTEHDSREEKKNASFLQPFCGMRLNRNEFKKDRNFADKIFFKWTQNFEIPIWIIINYLPFHYSLPPSSSSPFPTDQTKKKTHSCRMQNKVAQNDRGNKSKAMRVCAWKGLKGTPFFV